MTTWTIKVHPWPVVMQVSTPGTSAFWLIVNKTADKLGQYYYTDQIQGKQQEHCPYLSPGSTLSFYNIESRAYNHFGKVCFKYNFPLQAVIAKDDVNHVIIS